MYVICKLLYIALFSLLSAAAPYLPLYYNRVLNFSSDQIGFFLAIAPFIQSVACPLWTYLVDKKPSLHGPVMAITSFVGGSAIIGINLIGHAVSSQEVVPNALGIFSSLRLSKSALVLVISSLELTFAFFTLPNLSLVDSAVMKILGPNKILYGEQRLWGSVSAGFTILLVGQLLSVTGNFDMLFYVLGSATVLFMIFSCFAKVNEQDARYILVPETLDEPSLEHVLSHHTATGRKLVPVTSDTSEKLLNARAPVNTYNSMSSVSDNNSNSHYVDLFKTNSIASAHTIREEADETLDAIGHLDLGLSISRIASIDQSMAGLQDISTEGIPTAKNAIKSVRVLTFLMSTLVFGFILSVIMNYLFLFLSRDLHMPPNWIGWTGPTTGITELLCFCFSKQLTEKFGVTNMILIAHVATIVRCLAYTILVPDSFITNVCALSLQTLHGVGFGIFWATAVSEVDSFFPPEQRSVAQGILGALHFGLGTGSGALAGGYMFEYLGAVTMFRIVAAVAAFNIVLFYTGRLTRFE